MVSVVYPSKDLIKVVNYFISNSDLLVKAVREQVPTDGNIRIFIELKEPSWLIMLVFNWNVLQERFFVLIKSVLWDTSVTWYYSPL